jgi:hypothetical protein
VKKSLPSITSYLIEVRPELLHRENATGRTPLEMAADMYMQERVSRAPRLDECNNYNCYRDQNSLVHRPLSSFITVTDDNETPNKKRTYEICLEATDKHPGKRRLVSLFEANEVAKRLAGIKARSRTPMEKKRETEMLMDEVGE